MVTITYQIRETIVKALANEVRVVDEQEMLGANLTWVTEKRKELNEAADWLLKLSKQEPEEKPKGESVFPPDYIIKDVGCIKPNCTGKGVVGREWSPDFKYRYFVQCDQCGWSTKRWNNSLTAADDWCDRGLVITEEESEEFVI